MATAGAASALVSARGLFAGGEYAAAREQYAAALSFLTEEPAPPAVEAEPGAGGGLVADFQFPDEADMFRQMQQTAAVLQCIESLARCDLKLGLPSPPPPAARPRLAQLLGHID